MLESRQTQESFEEECAKGHKYQQIVARMLREEGFWVDEPKERIAKSFAEALRHVDPGDLFVWIPPDEVLVEVKSVSFNFTGLLTWPRRDGKVIVDRKATWDKKVRKRGRPIATVCISQQTEKCIIIPDYAEGDFFVEEVPARHRGDEDYYFVMIDKCRTWGDFVGWLRKGCPRKSESQEEKTPHKYLYCGACSKRFDPPGPPHCPHCGGIVFTELVDPDDQYDLFMGR